MTTESPESAYWQTIMEVLTRQITDHIIPLLIEISRVRVRTGLPDGQVLENVHGERVNRVHLENSRHDGAFVLWIDVCRRFVGVYVFKDRMRSNAQHTQVRISIRV